MAKRTRPNIIVTGTPGVGKTTHCEQLAKSTGLQHLLINDIVKQHTCHDGWDEVHQSYIVDEDKVGARRPFVLHTFLFPPSPVNESNNTNTDDIDRGTFSYSTTLKPSCPKPEAT